MMKQAIPYYRVSTRKQERSGLGLEAQEKAVHDFTETNGYEIIGEFTEVESGKNNQRPVLQKALKACRKLNAVLLIAKLDRLGRNLAFIAKLMESNVEFVAVDSPNDKEFELHIKACFAHKEGREISIRTKAALQAAKRRGVILGKFMRDTLSKRNKDRADKFAAGMQQIIQALKDKGVSSIRALAAELNRLKIATYTGKAKWHPRSVFSLLKRIDQLNQQSIKQYNEQQT